MQGPVIKPVEPKDDAKRPQGRPTKYQPDCCLTVVELMTEGLSFEAVCGELNISKDTAYRWVKQYPDFKAAKELGETKGQLFWEKKVLDNLITFKDARFNTTAFIFVMKNRFGWRDKKEISGSLGLDITGIDQLYKNWSNEQVDREIAVIMQRLKTLPEGPKR